MKKVTAVKANQDFSLDLKFNDGTVRRFNVKPYLDFGVFTELKELGYFNPNSLSQGFDLKGRLSTNGSIPIRRESNGLAP